VRDKQRLLALYGRPAAGVASLLVGLVLLDHGTAAHVRSADGGDHSMP
jgi:hypothetical protein